MHSASFSVGRRDAPRNVLVFHGYTGSPDEFHELADTLATKLDAHVTVPLFPGHGTTVDDLARFTLDELVTFALAETKKIAGEGKPFAIVGHSFGGHFALLSGAKYKPTAAVITVMPYELRPPFSIPGMDIYARTKAFWDKPLPPKEVEERKTYFYYKSMPGAALGYLKDANRRVSAIASQLTFPILAISNREDPMSYPEGIERLLTIAPNKRNKTIILEKKEHGLFYGPRRDEVIADIATFLEKQMGESH